MPGKASLWSRGLLRRGLLCGAVLASVGGGLAGWLSRSSSLIPMPAEFAPGVCYTNLRVREVPWSINVVRMDRTNPQLEVRSIHARGGVGAISTLTDQVRSLRTSQDEPLAAINGDFYARDGSAYTGDPRGLQVVDGELISAPNGGAVFWVDAQGQFHLGTVVSQFSVTWPDGTTMPIGLNEARRGNAVLYTPAMGPSTFTREGREWVLEPVGQGPWLPLQVGLTYTAKVREVRDTGDTPLSRGLMVLSVDPDLLVRRPRVGPGAVLRLSTATTPELRGARTALGGGPILVTGGRIQPIRIPPIWGQLAYEYRSMRERHPRSAIGWNARYFFLIQVDGRQPGFSVGMTLEELADFAVRRLGCTEVMNLDGGVSSTLWAAGRVRSNPCMGERPIANGLVVVRHRPSTQSAGP